MNSFEVVKLSRELRLADTGVQNDEIIRKIKLAGVNGSVPFFLVNFNLVSPSGS